MWADLKVYILKPKQLLIYEEVTEFVTKMLLSFLKGGAKEQGISA
jgi:hypothetical protein